MDRAPVVAPAAPDDALDAGAEPGVAAPAVEPVAPPAPDGALAASGDPFGPVAEPIEPGDGAYAAAPDGALAAGGAELAPGPELDAPAEFVTVPDGALGVPPCPAASFPRDTVAAEPLVAGARSSLHTSIGPPEFHISSAVGRLESRSSRVSLGAGSPLRATAAARGASEIAAPSSTKWTNPPGATSAGTWSMNTSSSGRSPGIACARIRARGATSSSFRYSRPLPHSATAARRAGMSLTPSPDPPFTTRPSTTPPSTPPSGDRGAASGFRHHRFAFAPLGSAASGGNPTASSSTR
ncbi:MAG TPA: hypothetical protein VFA20_11835 [Myxococcaceae bacterium]|nr:hypothetical protein [Myxococcaceae bacterium]